MLIRNTAVNLITLPVNLTLALLITALLARQLGPAAFGLVVLVRSIVGNVGMIETLFGVGVTRYVAQYHASEDYRTRDQFALSGLVANLLQGVLVSLCFMALSLLFFDRVFSSIPPSLRAAGVDLLVIFFGAFMLQVCSTSILRALEGLQVYTVIRLTEMLFHVVTFATLLLIFQWFPDRPLAYIGWLYLLIEGARLATVLAIASRHGMVFGSWQRVDRRTVAELLRYGKPLFVAKLFTTLSYRGDALLIGIFLSVEAVALYQAASQVWSGAVALLSALTTALLPAVVARSGLAGGEGVGSLYLRASRYTLAAAFCLAIPLVLFRYSLIDLWLGTPYRPAAVLIVLFMLQLVIAYHQGVSGIVALAMSSHQSVGRLEMIGSCINLAVSLLLIRWIGVEGVIVGAIVKAILITPAYVSIALRSLNIRPLDFVRACLMPVWRFVATGALGAVTVARFGKLDALDESLQLFMRITMVLLLLVASGWVLVVTVEDKKRLSRVIAGACSLMIGAIFL